VLSSIVHPVLEVSIYSLNVIAAANTHSAPRTPASEEVCFQVSGGLEQPAEPRPERGGQPGVPCMAGGGGVAVGAERGQQTAAPGPPPSTD